MENYGWNNEIMRTAKSFLLQICVWAGKYLPLILLLLWVDTGMGQMPPDAIPAEKGNYVKVHTPFPFFNRNFRDITHFTNEYLGISNTTFDFFYVRDSVKHPSEEKSKAIQKTVNDIFLFFLAKGEFTLNETQRYQLEGIIYECPLIAGRSIYQARALYRLVSDTVSYQDADVCLQQGVAWKLPSPQSYLKPTDTTGICKQSSVWAYGDGYQQNAPPPWGIGFLDFNHSPVKLDTADIHLKIDVGNTTYCDEAGELQFYTNGGMIMNRNHEPMKNTTNFNPSTYFDDPVYGVPVPQCVTAVPAGSDPNKIFLFHSSADVSPFFLRPLYLYYSVIDMNGDNGLGEMTVKNELLIHDTLPAGQITACKHGNGKDWWIVVPKYRSNCYYKYLLRNDTVFGPFTQCLGDYYMGPIGGLATFSPDGTKYVRALYEGKLFILDFDRCRGIFTGFRKIETPPIDTLPIWDIVEISPNSKYAYFRANTSVCQVRLDSVDNAINVIATWDGYNYYLPGIPFPWPVGFYIFSRAEDGRIYIASSSQTPYYHILENPDSANAYVVQRALELPRLNNSVSYHPAYCLGPAPTPCEAVFPTPISPPLPVMGQSVSAYPNPAKEFLTFSVQESASGIAQVRLYNGLGQEVVSQQCSGEWEYQINIQNLTPGTYYWQVMLDNDTMEGGKVVIER